MAKAKLSYSVFTVAQWIADSTIQEIVQTHSDQFPNAQRVLTAIYAAYGWFAMLYFIAAMITFGASKIRVRSTGEPYPNRVAALPVFYALLIIPLDASKAFQEAMPTDEHGRRAIQGSLPENLMVWASFMPNRVVGGKLRTETGAFVPQTHLACGNLPSEVYIVFVHPDEVVPDKVVVAEPRSGEVIEGALAYSYRVSICENSINPDHIK